MADPNGNHGNQVIVLQICHKNLPGGYHNGGYLGSNNINKAKIT
ncbi:MULTISPECIES: hypothetical protein [unclassified Synechocystis]|nr:MULTISPECIES: hypothetical protein [unclassified Synechocystis]